MSERVGNALGDELCVEQVPGSIVMRSASVTMQFDGSKVCIYCNDNYSITLITGSSRDMAIYFHLSMVPIIHVFCRSIVIVV